ncbi:MAG: hypothetical protein NTV51_13205 [Verrucomicrobia bacterium]|nr:hypothetical protein [Verrucomicrobiota bacterium]
MFLPEIATSPSPEALKTWLEVLFYVVGGITACVALWKMLSGRAERTEISGQPIEVRAAADLVSKADHEKHLAEIKAELGRHAARRAEIYEEQAAQGGDIKALKAEVAGTKDNLAKVEGKIDANTALTSRIDGKVEQINQSVSTLTSSVTNFMRDQANRK